MSEFEEKKSNYALPKKELKRLLKKRKSPPRRVNVTKLPKKGCPDCYERGWIGESAKKKDVKVLIIGKKPESLYVLTCR